MSAPPPAARELIPPDRKTHTLRLHGREVRLTTLDKAVWSDPDVTKGDLLRYYAAVSDVLLPHLQGRPMVMKRYPQGSQGSSFFMKRTPDHAPEWLEQCPVRHASGREISFPMVQDLASLLWVVNLGCIDLNPWVSRCDDTDRPDILHFDLDPVPGTGFGRVRETALLLRDTLDALGIPSYPKTTGSRGMHVHVPIVRGPSQKEVWRFAKALARTLEERRPDLVTTEYRVRARPRGRVLVDYNQNAWGQTLASVYSVRPRPGAPVSTPVRWDEVEAGVETGDFHLGNLCGRIEREGDLWRPLTWPKRRYALGGVLAAARTPGVTLPEAGRRSGGRSSRSG